MQVVHVDLSRLEFCHARSMCHILVFTRGMRRNGDNVVVHGANSMVLKMINLLVWKISPSSPPDRVRIAPQPCRRPGEPLGPGPLVGPIRGTTRPHQQRCRRTIGRESDERRRASAREATRDHRSETPSPTAGCGPAMRGYMCPVRGGTATARTPARMRAVVARRLVDQPQPPRVHRLALQLGQFPAELSRNAHSSRQFCFCNSSTRSARSSRVTRPPLG
jgi:hypothetical protein